MVTHKRGTVAWLFTAAVLITFSTLAIGQSNESGYTSKYLAHTSPAQLKSNTDNAKARTEAIKQSLGADRHDAKPFFDAALKEQKKNKNLLPGGNAPAGTPTWISLGPTKTNHIQNGISQNRVDSGRMRSILPNPSNPDVVYLLTSSGGLWKTTNFTKAFPTWTATTDSQFTTSGGAAAFGRNVAPGHETIYVGLGDPFDGTGLAGGIMLKTTDGGATWADPIFLPTASTIRDVKVDTTGPQDVIFVATDFGMYVSRDGGATYFDNALSHVFDGTFATGQEWSIAKSSQGWLVSVEDYITGEGSLMLTTDFGLSWTQVGTGLDNTGRMTLGVGAPGDAIVYSFSADPFDNVQRGLFKSTDGGQTFADTNLNGKTPINPNPDQPNMDIMAGQAFYNQMVLVDPTDATRNTVYIGGQLSSAKTTDGGNTWRIVSNWLAQFGLPYVHADFHAAAFSKIGTTKTLFFGSDGGLFTSTDGSKTWTDTKNVGVISIIPYSIMGNPFNSKANIMGLQDNGTFTSQGTAWNQTIGGDGFGAGWSQATGAHALGSVYDELIQHATGTPLNTQRKWTDVSDNFDICYGTFFTAIATPRAQVDPTGLVFYTYTHKQIYKTTDGGATWFVLANVRHFPLNHLDPNPNTQCTQITGPVIPSSPGLSNTTTFRDHTHGIDISPVAPNPNDPTADGKNHIAVVGTGGLLVTSHDGGATWHETPMIGSVPFWAGFNSSVAWADNQTLYVASESANFDPHLAKSTDGGLTFTNISGFPFTADNGLPWAPIDRVYVDPRNSNTVYVGTFLGLYRSTDAGNSWARFGAGLPMVEVSDIYMPPDGSYIRISTYGRGVWELDNPSVN
jgi:photosystem II stability/assembly factor-like uncharacterized protein